MKIKRANDVLTKQGLKGLTMTRRSAGVGEEGRYPQAELPRYRQIYEELHAAILKGAFRPGDRLPSEAELGKRYDTSRITVAKAVNELQLQGLVTRRPGSGTHVLAPASFYGSCFRPADSRSGADGDL